MGDEKPEKEGYRFVKLVPIMIFAVIILGFSTIIGIKILSDQIILNIGTIDVPMFLSIILAFFSIAISISFFYKTTEISNKFYSNIYGYLKEFSESIGRMDERFASEIKHFADMQQRASTGAVDPIKIEEQIKIKEEEMSRLIEEKDKEIEGLINKLQISKQEKSEITQNLQKQLQNQQRETLALSEEVFRYRNMLEVKEREMIGPRTQKAREYFYNLLLDNISNKHIIDARIMGSYERINEMLQVLSNQAINKLKFYEIIDNRKRLTEYGKKLLVELADNLVMK